MEFGDASDEEASSHDPPRIDLSNNQHLEAISMLLTTAMEDCLKRGSIMAVTKRFDMACLMIHRLWKQVEHMYTMGIINSPELYSQGKNSRRVPKYMPEFIEEGVKGSAEEKAYSVKAGKVDGVSKTTVHHWIVELTLHVHSNSLRPILTEENRLARFELAMDACDPVDQTKYQDMSD